MNTGIECDFDGFKRRCKELIDAAPTLDEAGRDNGIKMINLSYLNMHYTRDGELYQASIALRLTLDKVGAFA
jgi:hypothetical protein